MAKTIALGKKVKDTVTGYTGIVVARTQWLNGCVRVTVQPPVGKDGKVPDNATFDEPQLKEIGKGVSEGDHDTGGPLPFKPTQSKGPTR